MNIKEAKTHLRSFMREHYTDERLAWLLAHARAGKLAYNSCCCFIGVATADHALMRHVAIDCDQRQGIRASHYREARELPGAGDAEHAYFWLTLPASDHVGDRFNDVVRQRIIIPMILAEQRRRERKRRAVDQLDAFLVETGAMRELATA